MTGGDSRGVLLFHPRTEHEENYRNYWIPYSVFSLAAMIHDEADVRVWDENVDGRPCGDELAKQLENVAFVGVSSMTGRQIGNGLEFAASVRRIRTDLPIIWGGAHPTLFPNQMLDCPLVDAVVIGPGEVPIQAVFRERKNLPRLPKVPGLAWSGAAGVHQGGKAPPRPSRNFPPFPWDLLTLERYVRNDSNIAPRTLNYVSSQGCPFTCGFCSEVALHELAWNALPPERVVSDAKELVQRAKISGLKLYDANFFVNIRRALRFAKLITPLGLRWAAACHPASLLKLGDDQFAELAESGLCRLLVGLESGSQDALNLIRKQIKVAEMPVIAERLAAHGIVGSFTFVVGFPGVSCEIEPTLRLGERLRQIWQRHEVKVHFYAPYPGTPMWESALIGGFKPPSDLEGWINFDYYAITTPWVPEGWQEVVHEFNRIHCPYVHL